MHHFISSRILFLHLLCVALAGCNSKPEVPTAGNPDSAKVPDAKTTPGLFKDVTQSSGVAHTFLNGEEAKRYAILESLGGGVAMFDYDGDGLLDLYFPGGGFFSGEKYQDNQGYAPKLFRNLGAWKFTDVSKETGIAQLKDGTKWFYNHGVAVADYDRDGHPDLIIGGYGRVALFRNVQGADGKRRFEDVTAAAGLNGPHIWVSSIGFGDLDGDGFPDLYLTNYVNWSNESDPPCPGYFSGIPRDVCPPKRYTASPHRLYRNTGQGTFEDVSTASGIRTSHPNKDYGKGLGVMFVDVNLDGKPDIYVANDTTENFLYINESEPGKLRFLDRGMELGVALDGGGGTNGSMGIDAADYDGSGRQSIFVANYENELHALYRNMVFDKRMMFSYYTSPAGLSVIGPRFVGFG
ncbi:MAG: FG-GAP repeat domain-containing protein, partial [Gemmataceae bacterium]